MSWLKFLRNSPLLKEGRLLSRMCKTFCDVPCLTFQLQPHLAQPTQLLCQLQHPKQPCTFSPRRLRRRCLCPEYLSPALTVPSQLRLMRYSNIFTLKYSVAPPIPWLALLPYIPPEMRIHLECTAQRAVCGTGGWDCQAVGSTCMVSKFFDVLISFLCFSPSNTHMLLWIIFPWSVL